ncbi:hypothetical protein JCM8208_007711 [Rhodotorula glutinis]
MHKACALVRAAARTARAAADIPSPRSFSSAPPRQLGRTPRSIRPTTAEDWHRLRPPVDPHPPTPAIPPLLRGDRAHRRPELLTVKAKGTFNHPSLLSYELQTPRRDGAQRDGLKSYERNDIFGRALVEYSVKELLVDEIPSISAQALEGATRRLLRTDVLSELAVSYNLVSRLQADPVALDTIAADPTVHASLFFSYVASAKVEHGMDAARNWVRKLFRSVLTTEYPIWRAADEALERQQEGNTPLYHLQEYCKKRGYSPRWTVSSKGGVGARVFKAEVEFGTLSAVGSGRSIQLAKQNAATLALKLDDPLPEPGLDPGPVIAYTRRLHVYATAHELDAPVFETIAVAPPLYEARVTFDGHKAAKAMFEAIGVDAAGWAKEAEAAKAGHSLVTPSMVRFPSVLPRARSSIAYLLGNGPPSPALLAPQDAYHHLGSTPSTSTRPLDLRLTVNANTDAAHVVVPLTPTSASLVRRATSRRVGPPRRQNEIEQERLQGLMRSDTAVSRSAGGAAVGGGGAAEEARAERWARVKVWFAREGPSKLVFVLWIFLQLAMLGVGIVRYDMGSNFTQARAAFGGTYVIARASAFVLHVDIVFILLPVCRNFISMLRRSPLNRAVPFDKSVAFHEIVAWSIVFWSIVHTVAHLVNSWWLAATMTSGAVTCLLGALMVNGSTGPFITGWIMLALLGIIAWFAAEKRRKKHFQRFYYSHHLAVVFFFLWQLHGMFCMIRPDKPPYCAWSQIGVFWLFWSFGGIVYVSERILREVRSRHRTYLSKVIVHPGKTVELQIKKEKTTSRAGQYIMVNCPAISLWQWHPFTLTSAPEEDCLSIHFRVVGDWTQDLADALGCELDGRDSISKEIGGEDAVVPLVSVLPRIMIDGPFGTASEDVLKFPVSLLVGAGIGVTPFASILKHIWYRFHDVDREPMKLNKVYFFWICRDYSSFEWFQSLLAAIEAQDLGNCIEIHTYLTGRIHANDVINIFANDVGNELDAVTQLRSPTHYGRPNWDRIFASLAEQHPATDIGTFFCGPEPLAKTLHKTCIKFTSAGKGKTRFLFSKERF